MTSPASTTPAASADDRTALLGITTPLAAFLMPAVAGVVVAIVGTRVGVLTADLSPGAIVRGSGSNLLWMSGTAAQVDAKLTTLSYAGSVAGTDDLSILVLASDGTLTTAVRSTITVIPLTASIPTASALINFGHGTLTLESRMLDGLRLSLREPAGSLNSTTCVLINTTIGVHSQISALNDNDRGIAPRIAVAGRVELDGTLAFAGTGTTVSLAQGATFVNEGSITIGANAAQFIGTGTLINNGQITVSGYGAPIRIDTALNGSGVISLMDGASVEIGGSVGADETISLGAGPNTLHLKAPATFAGQIAGFSRGNLLILDGETVTAALDSRSAASQTDILTLLNGTSIVGTLRFSAPEAGTVIQLGVDATGDATLSLASATKSAASASVDVFRFFDAANGTQLLTQDQVERDAILRSRPDLHYEGVGLHALDPSQPGPDTTAIYRFFDMSNGTHFLTASVGERDTLLGSRPDLVFEPGSTLFEHAAAQAGDTAVYRFFDSQSGAHFFTADAGERASVLSTRPDMTLEGIAFYAPTL